MVSVFRNIYKYIVCLAPLWLHIFDITWSALGIKFEGSDDNPALILTSIAIFLVVGLTYLWSLWKNKKIYPEELCFFSALAIFFILYVMVGDRFWGNPLVMFSRIRKSIIYVSLCVLAFYTIRREHWLDAQHKAFTAFAWVATIIIAYRIFPQLTTPWYAVKYYGTLRYQSMGYLCAYVIAFLLVLLQTSKKKIYKLMCVTAIIVNMISLLHSGGRGAVIALAAVFAFVVITSLRNLTVKKVFTIASATIIVAVVAVQLIRTVPVFQDALSGTTRTFSYIQDDGISLDNRTDLYRDSMDLIEASPIIGYGVGSSYYFLGSYPHNLFMELMIDGGIPYTLLISATMLYRLVQWYKYYLTHEKIRLVVAMLVMNLMNLMVSGTYYNNHWFWLLMFFDVRLLFPNNEIPQELGTCVCERNPT